MIRVPRFRQSDSLSREFIDSMAQAITELQNAAHTPRNGILDTYTIPFKLRAGPDSNGLYTAREQTYTALETASDVDSTDYYIRFVNLPLLSGKPVKVEAGTGKPLNGKIVWAVYGLYDTNLAKEIYYCPNDLPRYVPSHYKYLDASMNPYFDSPINGWAYATDAQTYDGYTVPMVTGVGADTSVKLIKASYRIWGFDVLDRSMGTLSTQSFANLYYV